MHHARWAERKQTLSGNLRVNNKHHTDHTKQMKGGRMVAKLSDWFRYPPFLFAALTGAKRREEGLKGVQLQAQRHHEEKTA